MMNERAFYLPYVLIVSVITLAIITTTVIIYENEMKITNNLLEQLEIETLFQMARDKFIEDRMYNEETNGQINYTFPNGTVHINYSFVEENIVEVQFHAVTTNQYALNITHEIKIETGF